MPKNILLLTITLAVLTLVGCGSTPPSTLPWDDTSRTLINYYRQWQGTPYAWGGSSSSGIDCSAFTRLVYADVFNKKLPRQTRSQAKIGDKVSRSDLRPGDLLFFKTGWRRRHVGVYVGNGEFIHASVSEGVTRSSINSGYWDQHFWKATRPIGT